MLLLRSIRPCWFRDGIKVMESNFPEFPDPTYLVPDRAIIRLSIAYK
jgi:hypothetical protein